MNEPIRHGLNRTQVEVACGVFAAAVIGAGLAWLLWTHLGISPRPFSLAERLAFAARWALVPAVAVIAGVLMVANERFFAGGLDPLDADEPRSLRIWRRYVSNTVEQGFLFAISAASFAAVAPQYWLKAIPIAAALFALGRVLFVGGYLIRSSLRATGFVLTVGAVAALGGWSAWLHWFASA
jgi:hypothetical protein